MSAFWPEFLLIATVHLVAVASPGPDFAIVLRYAVRYGKNVALGASIGIGCAILLQVTYSLAGIALLIKTTPWLFQVLTVSAALYLGYIGIQALRARAPATATEAEHSTQTEQQIPSLKKAFVTGFITNGLNPKATLFFLSVFAVIISPATPISYKLIYGIYMSLATMLWFSLLSFLLTRTRVRGFLLLKGYWFDRLTGTILLGLALHLIYSLL